MILPTLCADASFIQLFVSMNISGYTKEIFISVHQILYFHINNDNYEKMPA